jgi:hypothetical protein
MNLLDAGRVAAGQAGKRRTNEWDDPMSFVHRLRAWPVGLQSRPTASSSVSVPL